MDAFTGKNSSVMNRRKSERGRAWNYDLVNESRMQLISHALTHTDPWDWEDDPVSAVIAATRTAPAQNKWQKKRLGAKKVKSLEK